MHLICCEVIALIPVWHMTATQPDTISYRIGDLHELALHAFCRPCHCAVQKHLHVCDQHSPVVLPLQLPDVQQPVNEAAVACDHRSDGPCRQPPQKSWYLMSCPLYLPQYSGSVISCFVLSVAYWFVPLIEIDCRPLSVCDVFPLFVPELLWWSLLYFIFRLW